MRVAGVCVLYNPNLEKFPEILSSLLKNVQEVWLIDNSEVRIAQKIKNSWDSDRINYIWLGENKGIAFALNEGCNRAMDKMYEWVLTIDQDSFLPDNCVDKYSTIIQSKHGKKIGIVTCKIKINESDSAVEDPLIDHVDSCWTSGSLMNMTAYKEVGGFDSEFFIDGVDIAYCLKIREKGYTILKTNAVVLRHELGSSKDYKLFGRHLFYVTHHNRLRRYYITRNYLKISELYGRKYPSHKVGFFYFIKTILLIILFENDKFGKLGAMLRGIRDYQKNNFGKFSVLKNKFF